MTARMDLARFKGAVRAQAKGLAGKGEALPAGALLSKSATLAVEAAGERRKLFTISTAAVDRDNDTIAVAGWDLAAYNRNPIVLWGHESYAPPIGRTVEIGVDGGALKAMVEFVPPDMPVIGEHADMVFRMVDAGFLHACSVGFRPLEWTVSKDRTDDDEMWWPAVDFTRQELLEWSICTIPSNPEATVLPGEERAAMIEAAKQATLHALSAAEQQRAAQAAAEAASSRLQAQRRQLRAACFRSA